MDKPLCHPQDTPDPDRSCPDDARGKLIFDADLLSEKRSLRDTVKRLDAKTFYTLFMHLDDEAKLDDHNLKNVRWFPREVRQLKLTQPTVWTVAEPGGAKVPLVPGDKLSPEEPWPTDVQPTAAMRFKLDSLEAGDVIGALTVKASKAPAWLKDDSDNKVMPLEAGDQLELVAPVAQLKGRQPLDVRLASCHGWATGKVTATNTPLSKDNGDAIGKLQPADALEVRGKSGAKSWVVARSRGLQGWVLTSKIDADRAGVPFGKKSRRVPSPA